MAEPGHVFVVQADVTTIDCDTWLCPTDQAFRLTRNFARSMDVGGLHVRDHEWTDPLATVWEPSRRTSDDPSSVVPLVILGNVGVEPPTADQVAGTIQGLLPVVRAFVKVACQELKPRSRRLRLALPLIGTGEGGLAGATGSVIAPLLEELHKLAQNRNVDFVLCTIDSLAWSAVQRARRDDRRYWDLNPAEEGVARRLACEAKAGRLVLFIGAGVSKDAGLPDWRELLAKLAQPEMSSHEIKALETLDLRDLATLIERRVGGRDELLRRMRTEVDGTTRFGLTHALLASLPVEPAVTTNYDRLYERACTPPGQSPEEAIAVLPYGLVREGGRWLLKLHGTLGRDDDDLVLTRADYMGLHRTRGALFGIVQALLVTRHLLFVGYSLIDEDFHQLVDEIRSAIGHALANTAHRDLGTVLTIEQSPLSSLWTDLLDVQTIGRGKDVSANARRLQIVLDRVAHLATSHHAHLLDPKFSGLLDGDERAVAAAMTELDEAIDGLKDSPSTRAARGALKQFGSPRPG